MNFEIFRTFNKYFIIFSFSMYSFSYLIVPKLNISRKSEKQPGVGIR